MGFLVKVGGDIYIPCRQCSAGALHYGSAEAEPVEISVNPNKSVRWYVGRLVGRTKNIGDFGDPTERVNLVYEEVDDLRSVDSLAYERNLDLFVEAMIGTKKRFLYRNGKMFFEGQQLGWQQSVSSVFGETHSLELTHIGSPGVEYKHLLDDDVVYDWTLEKEKEDIREIRARLQKYGLEITEDLDITHLSILLAVAESEDLIDEYEIINCLESMDYQCRCYFEDFDIEWYLDKLIGLGYLKGIDGQYIVPSRHREDIVRDMSENFVDIDKDLVDTDPVSAGIMLALSEGRAEVGEITGRVQSKGFEAEKEDVIIKLERLVYRGLVRENNELFEVSPEYKKPYVPPNQLSFLFLAEKTDKTPLEDH